MEMGKFDFNKTTDEMFVELITKALTGKQSNFEFIRSYEMYKVAKLYRRGVAKVAKLFKQLADEIMTKYTKIVATGQAGLLEVIMSYKQFRICADYYNRESAIAKDMMKEFHAYVFGGHILKTMLGGVRPDFECVDYRKLPWTLF